jgi:hypothetical protein
MEGVSSRQGNSPHLGEYLLIPISMGYQIILNENREKIANCSMISLEMPRALRFREWVIE